MMNLGRERRRRRRRRSSLISQIKESCFGVGDAGIRPTFSSASAMFAEATGPGGLRLYTLDDGKSSIEECPDWHEKARGTCESQRPRYGPTAPATVQPGANLLIWKRVACSWENRKEASTQKRMFERRRQALGMAQSMASGLLRVVGERDVLFLVPDGLQQSQPEQIAAQTSTLAASRRVLERGNCSRFQG